MDSLPSFYAQQLLNFPARYSLSTNAVNLLRAHDEWKTGRIETCELGRIVRMSPNMRKAITETITRCAELIGRSKNTDDDSNLVKIITACTEMLTAAGKL